MFIHFHCEIMIFESLVKLLKKMHDYLKWEFLIFCLCDVMCFACVVLCCCFVPFLYCVCADCSALFGRINKVYTTDR